MADEGKDSISHARAIKAATNDEKLAELAGKSEESNDPDSLYSQLFSGPRGGSIGDPLPNDELRRRREETVGRRTKRGAWVKEQRKSCEYTSCREIVEKKHSTYKELGNAIEAGDFEGADGRSGVLLYHPRMGAPEEISQEDPHILINYWRDIYEDEGLGDKVVDHEHGAKKLKNLARKTYLSHCWIRTGLWRKWEECRAKLPYEAVGAAPRQMSEADDAPRDAVSKQKDARERGYVRSDKGLLDEMHEMIRKGGARNPWDAARKVVSRAKGATEESKMKRLVTKFNRG